MKQYVVKAGDTLWAISNNEYGTPNRWSEIYHRNLKIITQQQQKLGRRHLRGPDWIYPGTALIV